MASNDNLFERTAMKAPGGPSGEDAKVMRAMADVLSGAVAGAGVEDLAGLRQLFARAGLESQYLSWMTRKPNLELTPVQLHKALQGTQVIAVLERRTGLGAEDLADRLCALLPRLVSEVTPFGADDDPKAVLFHLQGLRKRLRG